MCSLIFHLPPWLTIWELKTLYTNCHSYHFGLLWLRTKLPSNWSKPENSSLLRKKNTKEIIINPIETRIVKYWEGSRTRITNYKFGILARLRHFVPTETLLMIYRSFVMPYLCYGISVWGRPAKSYISKLLVPQKRALWLFYFAPSDAHAIPLFNESKILLFNMIYFDTAANDIWKGLAPSPIRALFTRSNEIHGYNTRHAAKGNYIRKEVKLEIFKRSFSRTGVMLWNQISPKWRDVSKPIFKKTIRRFLFDQILSDRDDYVEVDTGTLTQFLSL